MAGVMDILQLLFLAVWYYLEAIYLTIFPRPPKDITGQVVLVTGAGKGIGRCIAIRFARQGAKLAILDVDENGNEETVSEIKKAGGQARGYVCDITKPAAVKETAKKVRQELGEVDILVNNAGIMICKDLLSLTEKEIRLTMEVNTMAHFWTLQEFLPHMMEQNQGHIVTTASMSGRHGSPLLTDYTASKFAVVGLQEAVEAEMRRFGKDNIKFTVVCPMGVNTNLLSSIKDRVTLIDETNPILQPDEVASMVVDGVLRDKHLIVCPDKMKNTILFRELTPRKLQKAVSAKIPAGFFPTN